MCHHSTLAAYALSHGGIVSPRLDCEPWQKRPLANSASSYREAPLKDTGTATGKRQANSQDGVDNHLGIEVGRAQIDQLNVDEVGQCPQCVEKDHEQEDIAGA